MKNLELLAGILAGLKTAFVYRLKCTFYHLTSGDRNYGFVKPYATYTPWNNDPEFGKVFWAIAPFTMIDWYRLYELWQLVEQTAHLEGSLMEIGVWRGGSGALIAKQAERSGINDPVYLCDTFQGVVKASERDRIYKGGEHADTSIQKVHTILGRLQLKNVKILTGIFPDDTEHLIPANERFRFCHVDVDVYDGAKDIVDWMWDRLVVGGMMVYDDYGFMICDGVTRFVNEQRGLDDRIVIHNLNGHAIVIKTR
jgi:O-methyltransferase